MLRGLRSAFYHVEDLSTAKAWYTELLGEAPYFDEAFYVGFDVSGYELGLLPSGSPNVAAAWAVVDPEAAVSRAVALGATIKEPPRDVGEGIIVATVTDPFGNDLELIRNPGFAPELVHAGADNLSARSISIEATVPISPERAWDLWTSTEGVAEWWTPNTKIDMRPGGSYEIYFYPENLPGERGADWCRVLSFLPGRMLSFTWNAPPHLKTRPLYTWVVLTFDPVGDGTRVTLDHLGWPEDGLASPESDWPETFEYFESAWAHVIGLFSSHFGEGT